MSPVKRSLNVFEGKWVWGNLSYPLYTEKSCPYLVKQVTCQRNGRPDSSYQNWRFNALKFLEILRDNRLMFVGDSVQRSMFYSMVCLVESAIPEGKKSLQKIPPRKIFRAEEFNASIEFYWAPFLVESNSGHTMNHTVLRRFVKLDSINQHSKQWYRSPNNVEEYNVTTAYRIAMETWANWTETNNPNAQKLFFMTMSPTHLWSYEWNVGTDGNCFGESQPIQRPYWGTGSSLDIMGIVKDVLGQMRINVKLLNITQLSEFRKDGHTSVYGERKASS